MRELFSRELLADIHIRLDREGLQGLTEKESTVLLSETITHSATLTMEHAETQTDRLIQHINAQTERLVQHMDAQTDRLIQHMDAQTDRLVQHMDAQTQQLMKHSEIQTDRILRELQPIREDLAYFRLRAKFLIGGVWAVAASIIAGILLQFFVK